MPIPDFSTEPQPGPSTTPISSNVPDQSGTSSEKFEGIRVRRYDPRTRSVILSNIKTIAESPSPVLGNGQSDSEGDANILKDFQHDLKHENEEKVTNFCCGGLIPIWDLEDNPHAPHGGFQLPVEIRWPPKNSFKMKVLTFPTDNNLGMLWSDCELGFSSKSLEGGSLREPDNLRMLNPHQFDTNFNEHNSGIVSAIRQIMLPSVVRAKYPHMQESELGTLGIFSSLTVLEVRIDISRDNWALTFNARYYLATKSKKGFSMPTNSEILMTVLHR